MPNYHNGKIYKILNTITEDIYIGSTIQPLSKRMHNHKRDATTCRFNMLLHEKMNELGIDNFYIELFESYPCETREELHAREGYWIRELSTLNKRVAGRKRYQYREDKAETIKAKNKQYYEKNIERITEFVSKKVCCELCGKSVRYDSLKKHKKSQTCITNNKLIN